MRIFLFLNSSDLILDMLSVERNYILVRAYVVGGPSERIIPPRCLLEVRRLFIYLQTCIKLYQIIQV